MLDMYKKFYQYQYVMKSNVNLMKANFTPMQNTYSYISPV